MKSIIIYSFLILTDFISAQTIPDSMTFNGHTTYHYATLPDSIYIRTYTYEYYPEYTKQIHFGDWGNGFTITWENSNIEILYGKDTKPSQAVKQFFDWLKDFIKGDYYIIRKQSLKELLQLKEIK